MNGIKDDGVHRVAPSLYLQIREQGTRSWLFRYSRNGRNQWMGLGSLQDKPLTEARDEAAMLRVLVKRGEVSSALWTSHSTTRSLVSTPSSRRAQ